MRYRKKQTGHRMRILSRVLMTALLLMGLSACSAEEVPTTEPIPPNLYDPEAFYTENGFLHYGNQDHRVGIDVSVYQGIIDWQAVRNAGVEFAVIRAGYRGSTVGDLYEDEQFSYNLEEARKAGIHVGVYFFSQALTPEEAVEEAEFVCGLLGDKKPDLPVYFDWEFNGGRIPSAYDVPLTDCASAFCREVEARGYEAGIYFNQDFGYHHFRLRELQDYHLWLAEYGEIPSFKYHFDCLQYSDSGTVPGIETPVDLDLLFIEEPAEELPEDTTEQKKSPA